MLRKKGKKSILWEHARKRLEDEYFMRGIVKCEYPRCTTPTWALSFHHLEKRSRSLGGKHTFNATRLLCCVHHDLVENSEEENEKLFNIR